MATINESPVLKQLLNTGTGILRSHLSNRFVLKFNTHSSSFRPTFSQDCFDFLSLQLLGLKLDLKNSTISLELEQPLNNYEFFLVLLKELADMPYVEIQVLGATGNPGDELVLLLTLEKCKLKDHDFTLHYAESGTAKHKLTFKFDFKLIRDKIICQIHDLEKKRVEEKTSIDLPVDTISSETIPSSPQPV